MKQFFLIVSIGLIFIGCATTYQAARGRFGYRDSRLQENIFSISFQGNASCNQQTAQDYAFLRAAELCIQHGYQYFSLNSYIA